jgi:signal transduction histidine kinase
MLQQYSLKRKLLVIMTLASVAGLLLASFAFVAYELVVFRRGMVRDLSVLADIVGANSTAALAFNDARAAGDTLSALRAEPNIVSARIYAKEGGLFATYQRDGAAAPPLSAGPPPGSHAFGSDHLAVSREIVLAGETIGSVTLASDLEEMRSRLRQYSVIVAVVLAASSLFAFLLSTQLQRIISRPILHLAETAKLVSREKNFRVRASKFAQDETGVLIDGFNEMLDQIEMRDAALMKAQEDLERRVEERTSELQLEIIQREQAQAELDRLNEELEQRVKQRTAELTAANRELAAFSYSVSHDLRAPLRKIDGFSQALLEDYGHVLEPEAMEYLDRVRAASQQMAQLIDDLLNLSRLTRSEMRRESVDLSAMARSIIADLKQRQPARDVCAQIQEGLAATADERLLRIALSNLLGNAWKFTEKEQKARIEFGMLSDDGCPAFFVRDNGAGFDMAYANKLFGPFQRLHTQDEFEGTGVGLATVQRIVNRHGGRIWAEAAVGRGATFYFTL